MAITMLRIPYRGLVVARQRPETAHGATFILLEDEHGTVNLIVGAKLYERHRELVRTAPLLRARGRLERHEGATNVIVAELAPLEYGDPPAAEVRQLDPSAPPQDAAHNRARRHAAAELRAVAPGAHTFGRRAR